jgi:caffeoyl-CoA O-methyltransferase
LPAAPPIDLAFIDADKPNYLHYYEAILERLRPNGVILVDNVLWSGAVLDAAATDDNTTAIKALNDFLARDERVETVMLPISDGLTVLRKC